MLDLLFQDPVKNDKKNLGAWTISAGLFVPGFLLWNSEGRGRSPIFLMVFGKNDSLQFLEETITVLSFTLSSSPLLGSLEFYIKVFLRRNNCTCILVWVLDTLVRQNRWQLYPCQTNP